MKKLALFLLSIIHYLFATATDTLHTSILFEFDQYDINTTAQQQLDIDLSKINMQNIYAVYIIGHTDQIGSYQYNKKLSLQRATTIKNYLLQKNIETFVIEAVQGLGKTQLITNSLAETERQKNRRVELTIIYTTTHHQTIITPTDTIYEEASPTPVYTTPKKIKQQIQDSSVKKGSTIQLPYILFVGGMHRFLQISYPYLDELFYALRDNATLEIEIQGHICCANGTEDGLDYETGQNNLSVERAKAVYDFLVKKGIDKNRLSYKGFGHKFPLTLERNSEEQTRNRRVEIKIIKK